ncbi:MAG: hypothetical protein JNJ61_24950 [Anaerolineae bacterium]|nr:hypothetical protein [Anaerolineae bacterium]
MMQTLNAPEVDARGYPIGHFEEIYGLLADEPLERNQPPYPDMRDEMA